MKFLQYKITKLVIQEKKKNALPYVVVMSFSMQGEDISDDKHSSMGENCYLIIMYF